MSEIEDGGPAFPSEQGETSKGWNQTYESGLTKREYFAARALQGMLANPSINIAKSDLCNGAFNFADKMIRDGKGE